jgi:hypothetical protein
MIVENNFFSAIYRQRIFCIHFCDPQPITPISKIRERAFTPDCNRPSVIISLMNFLLSAGEASGDTYGAQLIDTLSARSHRARPSLARAEKDVGCPSFCRS